MLYVLLIYLIVWHPDDKTLHWEWAIVPDIGNPFRTRELCDKEIPKWEARIAATYKLRCFAIKQIH